MFQRGRRHGGSPSRGPADASGGVSEARWPFRFALSWGDNRIPRRGLGVASQYATGHKGRPRWRTDDTAGRVKWYPIAYRIATLSTETAMTPLGLLFRRRARRPTTISRTCQKSVPT